MSGARLTERDIEAIRAAYVAGTATCQIAVTVGCDRRTVGRAVGKLVAAGQLEPREPRATPALREAIRENAHRTISHSALAAELGCSVWQVRTIRCGYTLDAKARARKSYRDKLRQREIADSEAPRDRLGAALARFAPLASLPDRVAVLGIPVVVRRAA